MSDETVNVTRNEEAGRYEIHVGDALGGFTEFVERGDGRVIFPHTQLDPAFKGQGLGSKLVSEAMKDAATRGDTVVPVCPFVAKFLTDKPVEGLKVQWPARRESEGGAGAAGGSSASAHGGSGASAHGGSGASDGGGSGGGGV